MSQFITKALHVFTEQAVGATNVDELYIKDESCWFWDKQGHPEPDYESLKAANGEAGISQACEGNVSWVQSRLDDWRIYHFHDTSEQSPMKRIADVNDNHFLRSDGSNIPAYLLLLREQNLSNYLLIRNTVRSVAPFLDDFQLAPLRRHQNKIRLEWMHKLSDQYFDVSSLSDGTLRFICLATLLLQPTQERPSPILLDEPELGLHPYAITMFANMVKAAAQETQIIISTQSSLLLDHFEPEDILVTELEEGATTLNRLQSSELEAWLEDYSLGQLWEKN